MKPYLPLRAGVNRNDRVAALLDMGISPGEDESYDVQARRLMAQKDQLIDTKKLNILQQIESAIQTARNKGAPEGPLSPLDFATQTLAKTIPSPSEVDINKFSRDIPEIGQGILEVAKHPLASAKQAILNGPPNPTTVASMLVPGAALKAYRELVPLETRTYLHHMAGIPTPFTRVNERERQALTQMAQDRIDELLKIQHNMDQVKAYALKNINDIKLMKPAELVEYAQNEGVLIDSDKFKTKGPYKNSDSYFDINKLRDFLINDYKEQRPSIFMDKTTLKARGYLGNEMDNANVREEFEKLTGKQLRAIPVPNTDEFATAFGKAYVEPTIDKTTGRIVPKAIKDTYKFYPDVYSFDKGEARAGIKAYFDMILKGHFQGGGNITNVGPAVRDFIKNVFRMNAHEPAGTIARKLGMRRPTSIIDIPLQTPAPMNAYDKAAILLGAKALASKKE